MTGVYRLKNEALRPLFDEVERKVQQFRPVVFQHVRREDPLIAKADRILNERLMGARGHALISALAIQRSHPWGHENNRSLNAFPPRVRHHLRHGAVL